MKVSKIEGWDLFLRKLIKAKQDMEPLLKSTWSDEALKQLSDPVFALIPNKAVKKGDSWEWETAVDMGPIGRSQTTYRCIYEGTDEKNLQVIKVLASLRYKVPGPNAEGVLPFKILKADITSKDCKGDILFDSEKGRVNSFSMIINLNRNSRRLSG